MKRIISIFAILFTMSCSLDNKTGIWNDASKITGNTQDIESLNRNNLNPRYEDIFVKNKIFNEEVEIKNRLTSRLDEPIKIKNWLEKYGNKTNNVSNFSYRGDKKLISRSSRLSKLPSNKNIIFYNNKLISTDHKGKIFVYSLNTKKKIFEYNFYKNKFKNFDKKIYLIIKNNIVYAADNLGYLYAIDLNSKLLIWAKNYGIPFRSNLKLLNDQIFLANQDNVIYSVNRKTGNKNWQFSTNLTSLKSDFENNFLIDEISKNLLFLNTSGELYSIGYLNQQINWVINFKKSTLAEDTNLFSGQPMVLKNNNLIITTKRKILSFNSMNSLKNWEFPSDSILKPVITTNFIYLLSKKNLLICLESKSGKVLWSKNIYKNMPKKYKKKKLVKCTI